MEAEEGRRGSTEGRRGGRVAKEEREAEGEREAE